MSSFKKKALSFFSKTISKIKLNTIFLIENDMRLELHVLHSQASCKYG